MTTEHHDWSIFELERRAEPPKRGAVISELALQVGTLLASAGFRSVQAVFWTPHGEADTPFHRKRGFWQSQPAFKASLPKEMTFSERALSSGGSLRFVATARGTRHDLVQVLKVCHAYSRLCSFVGISADFDDWDNLTALNPSIFLGAYSSELDLLKRLTPICKASNVIALLPFGRFDDRECGLMGVGPKSPPMTRGWGDSGPTWLT